MKFFSIKEAEALIPEFEEVFAGALKIRDKAESKAARLRELEEGGKSNLPEVTIERSQLQFLVNTVNEWLDKVRALGGVPRGIDPAVVDIPGRLAGREVYLCWRRGEKKIGHYHGPNEDCETRKPLPKEK